jgi:hypothetical protein
MEPCAMPIEESTISLVPLHSVQASKFVEFGGLFEPRSGFFRNDAPLLFAMPQYNEGSNADQQTPVTVTDCDCPLLGSLKLFRLPSTSCSPRSYSPRDAQDRRILECVGFVAYYQHDGPQNLFRFDGGCRPKNIITATFADAAVTIPKNASVRDYLRVLASLGARITQTRTQMESSSSCLSGITDETSCLHLHQMHILDALVRLGQVSHRVVNECSTASINAFMCSCMLKLLTTLLSRLIMNFFGMHEWVVYCINGTVVDLLNTKNATGLMQYLRSHPNGILTKVGRCTPQMLPDTYTRLADLATVMRHLIVQCQANSQYPAREQIIVRDRLTVLLEAVADFVCCISAQRYGHQTPSSLPWVVDESADSMFSRINALSTETCASRYACLMSISRIR